MYFQMAQPSAEPFLLSVFGSVIISSPVIGRHKKMLSSDWLQNFQYNPTEPGHGRLLCIRKARLLTVHQFVQAGFVCLD